MHITHLFLDYHRDSLRHFKCLYDRLPISVEYFYPSYYVPIENPPPNLRAVICAKRTLTM